MDKLNDLFESYTGKKPTETEELNSSGSNRRYFRLKGGNISIIGVVGTSLEENKAFISLSRHFRARGINVPEVFAVSDDGMRYIQEDLGDGQLYKLVSHGRDSGEYSPEESRLLCRAMAMLPKIQFEGAKELDWNVCYPEPAFNERMIMFDLNYFKYCFLKPTDLDFHELKLEANFRMLAKDLTAEDCDGFLYRDFQARNVMLVPTTQHPTPNTQHLTPYFIDFQGGRRGPFYYDLASFLWQASAKYPHKLRRDLVMEYYQALKQYTEVPSTRHFVERLALFVLFRTLQVLGAYGFRGYFERKKHFIDSIPPAMQNLRELLKEGEGGFGYSLSRQYPYLVEMLHRLTELPQFAQIEQPALNRADGYKTTDKNPYKAHPQDGPATYSKYDGKGPLVVRVFSFSYRKGIPEDESGNGGGYVFDCRSTHNPGRYEPYKKLTGLDEPVIRFLEDDGEILTFLESVYRLADAHVRRYIQRGFTSLMFSFGCTGGQHRSVYSAQHLAEHIHRKFGIEVHINHREQGITQVLKNI